MTADTRGPAEAVERRRPLVQAADVPDRWSIG